mgnify:CR=1 FL=1
MGRDEEKSDGETEDASDAREAEYAAYIKEFFENIAMLKGSHSDEFDKLFGFSQVKFDALLANSPLYQNIHKVLEEVQHEVKNSKLANNEKNFDMTEARFDEAVLAVKKTFFPKKRKVNTPVHGHNPETDVLTPETKKAKKRGRPPKDCVWNETVGEYVVK